MMFGFDIHGVIDTKPKFYSTLTHRLVALGHEVHIITGASLTSKLYNQLNDWNIEYTHTFSITDYHKLIGTPIKYKDSNNPIMDNCFWDVTKAEYCGRAGIDLHIDDSPTYGKYFKGTVYLEVKNIKKGI